MVDLRAALVAVLVVLGAMLHAAQALAQPVQPVRLQLDAMPVSELVTILYRDVLRVPYVVAPEVSGDRRPASIYLVCQPADARARVIQYLRALGLVVVSAGGVDQIRRGRPAGYGPTGYASPDAYSSPQYVSGDIPGDPSRSYSPPPALPQTAGGSVAPGPIMGPSAAALPPVEQDRGVYRPRFRDALFLADLLRAVFPDLRFASRAVVAAQGDSTLPQAAPDLLVFAGPAPDVRLAFEVLASVDVEQASLSIKATVYEVQTGHSNGSAVSIAAGLLGGTIAIGGPSAGAVGDNYARFNSGKLSVVVSILNSDSRFRVVTSPSVLARSGTEAVLTSGSQVPVLGAVSYEGDSGRPVQSVDYRDSGVILRVRPTVHADTIDLDVGQELSSFARTTTGVDNSPTLNKRSLVNHLSMRSGDVVILGGLTEERDSKTRAGLFRGLLGKRLTERSRTEIMLVLQVVQIGGVPADARSDVGASTSVGAPAVVGGVTL